MTLTDILEKDEAKFTAALAAAGTPERAQKAYREETGRLLLLYNEQCDMPERREAAAYMLRTAEQAAALIDTAGEVKVFLKAEQNPAEQRKIPLRSRLFLAAACICALAAFFIAVLADPDSFRATDLILALILAAAAPAFGWLSGRSLPPKAGANTAGANTAGANTAGANTAGAENRGESSYYTEIRIDPGKMYRDLHNLTFAIDQNLDHILPAAKDRSDDGDLLTAAGIPESEADLLAGLLEAACSGDGDYMIEKAGDIRFYLHRHGIEPADYDGTNDELFDFMPAKTRRTIRPALTCGGTVVRRGMAAGDR